MGLNKIQVRALVFKAIEPIRNAKVLDDPLVEGVLAELREIEGADFEFISRLLIKEAGELEQKPAAVLLILAENLSPESFVAIVLNELRSNRISDDKKMFFMNILSGYGINFQPDEIGAYLKNPDEAINRETLRFLDDAKVEPEAQIDFLDFYFSSSNADKKELLNSVVSDFEGDMLVNILSSLALSIDEPETILYCLEIMEKSNSLLGIKPFKYLSEMESEPEVQKFAKKCLRKFSLKGIYTEEKLLDFYKDILKDFKEPKCIISLPDGNSNFSIVVVRQNKDGAYYILFVAVNTQLGPFSCFGFSGISENDYNSLLRRFFNSSKQITISPNVAKRILTELLLKRIALNKSVPYEYYCWERITDDIEEAKGRLEDLLTEGIKTVEINPFIRNIILKAPFIENWFFKCSRINTAFCDFMDEVVALKGSHLEKMEDLLIKYSKNEQIQQNIKTRIMFLCYCLKSAKTLDIADIFYSLLKDEEELSNFIVHILKRSVYEYMLTLRMPKDKSESLFKKHQCSVFCNFIPYINYIEENWVAD